jgi:hypothetical protein
MGHFRGLEMHGHGTLYDNNKIFAEGEFENGFYVG